MLRPEYEYNFLQPSFHTDGKHQNIELILQFLSMKLSTVNPRLDLNIEGLLSKDVWGFLQSHSFLLISYTYKNLTNKTTLIISFFASLVFLHRPSDFPQKWCSHNYSYRNRAWFRGVLLAWPIRTYSGESCRHNWVQKTGPRLASIHSIFEQILVQYCFWSIKIHFSL